VSAIATHRPTITGAETLGLVILKVAARCNLNCTYCYEFNLADHRLARQPRVMSEEVFEATLERVRSHARTSGQGSVRFSFHGGEPCLLGLPRFDAWCTEAREQLSELTVRFSMQTNGTLLDEDWIEVLNRHEVDVGVSLDGPKAVNDAARIDHAGKGSYDNVVRGLQLLQEGGVRHGVLCVIPLGRDPLSVHHHFLNIGCRSLSYLYPDFTHDTFGDIRERFGPTPCADFLIPIFDDWWGSSSLDVRIRNFWEMARLILGGPSHIDALGNIPLRFVVVNPSGDVEGLDVLKACGEGVTQTGLNVLRDDFVEMATASPVHYQMIFQGAPLPSGCRGCSEETTCAGGYHPHRYSAVAGFDNRSVWCADLLKLFRHMRRRLEVTPGETRRLRDELLAAT